MKGIEIPKDRKAEFEKVCLQNDVKFTFKKMTDGTYLIYEVEATPDEIFWLGVRFSLACGQ